MNNDDFLFHGHWVDVDSSWVSAVQYFYEAQELSVEFKDGAICIYSGIYPDMALDFVGSSSKGKWVWKNLYHRSYRLLGVKGTTSPYSEAPQASEAAEQAAEEVAEEVIEIIPEIL